MTVSHRPPSKSIHQAIYMVMRKLILFTIVAGGRHVWQPHAPPAAVRTQGSYHRQHGHNSSPPRMVGKCSNLRGKPAPIHPRKALSGLLPSIYPGRNLVPTYYGSCPYTRYPKERRARSAATMLWPTIRHSIRNSAQWTISRQW